MSSFKRLNKRVKRSSAQEQPEDIDSDQQPQLQSSDEDSEQEQQPEAAVEGQSEEEEEDSAAEEEAAAAAVVAAKKKAAKGRAYPKTKVLVLCTRGATHRFRHLMMDIRNLLPHSKKEAKLDVKDRLGSVAEIGELHSCTHSLLFESRKHMDLYMWATALPDGPGCKFLVENVHTLDELRLTGNALKGSRAVLSFGTEFSQIPHLRLIKSIMQRIFNVPQGHPKSKPFVDRVITFTHHDDRVWFRHYQIVEGDKEGERELVEIGPRFALNPIRIFTGAFGGPTLYSNPKYVSPNALRRSLRMQRSGKYINRRAAAEKRDNVRVPMPSDDMDVFGEDE